MIGKNELLSIPQLAREVEKEEARIESMRAQLTSPQAGFDSRDKVQSSGSQHPALVDVIIDLEQQLSEKRAMLSLMERQAQMLITRSGLTGEDSALMVLRYVEAYSWETVVELMHYSRATVFRKHNELIMRIFGEDKDEEYSMEL